MAEPGFEWTELYTEIAEKIKTGGEQWIKDAVRSLVPDLLPKSFYQSKDAKHEAGDLRDSYDPFSFFALFNYDDEKRIKILNVIKGSGMITGEIPDLFHGIPSIYNPHIDIPSRALDFSEWERSKVIDKLWKLFNAAMAYADSVDQQKYEAFIVEFDAVKAFYGSGWFTTTSILYEMRPDVFLPLDSNTRRLLSKSDPPSDWDSFWKESYSDILKGTAPTAEQYLKILDHVSKLIDEQKLGDGIISFPALSYNAWKESSLLRTADKRGK